MCICGAGFLLFPLPLQQVLCVSDLLASPPWADGGVFSEGEGPKGESHPHVLCPELGGVPLCNRAVPCHLMGDGPEGGHRAVNARAEQGTILVHEGN